MTSLHFAQISDIHISALGDRYEMLSGHSANFLADIVSTLNQIRDLDFVLFMGDLIDTANEWELECFQQTIETLQKPYYVIPGNHDRRDLNSAEGLTRHQFARYFNPQIEARLTDPQAQNGYWSLTIHSDIQLIGLDSIRDKDWGGIIDATQIEWLKSELAIHTDKLTILAVHHPFHSLSPVSNHPDYTNFVCDNGAEMLALLDNYPHVKVVLTAHHHVTKVDMFGQRVHLACPAVVGYPCAYRTLRLNRESPDSSWLLKWQTHPIADEATTSKARQLLIANWAEVISELNFAEEYARLAWGKEEDRNGEFAL